MNYKIAREHQKTKLRSINWDVLVIGGGASGTGVALDCALRGLSVALVEQEDFAVSASGASTKLVHGGVRYLEKAFLELDWGQFALVREALQERKRMIRNAPHLARPLGTILPVTSQFEWWYYRMGLWLYDKIAGIDELPDSQTLSKEKIASILPHLTSQGMVGGILYYDGQFDDARYAVAIARTAEKQGACILNHCAVVHFKQLFSPEKQIQVVDTLTGESFLIQTRVIVNCTGSVSDKIRQQIRPNVLPRLRPSKGAHIILDPSFLNSDTGLIIPKTDDGRVVFVLPWHGYTLIGTTDTEVKDPYQTPEVTETDIQYLLDYYNRYFEKKATRQDVKGFFAGNRPLVVQQNKSGKQTEALIRNHEVEIWEQEKVINLLGGKWTTYRQMAEETTDAIFTLLNRPMVRCQTASFTLIGATNLPVDLPNQLPTDIKNYLSIYGAEAPELAHEIIQTGIKRLHPDFPFTTAEVNWIIRNQFACTAEDILSRRLRWTLLDKHTAETIQPKVQAQLLETVS
ncbi:MAG: glycerol-3-phosphate dehydrogenase/oxidase [Bacteroidia bacterium]|nr:glycerol-3-phosphate dehydrogenase/oxidase [Bacteroidia bacterium]